VLPDVPTLLTFRMLGQMCQHLSDTNYNEQSNNEQSNNKQLEIKTTQKMVNPVR
jgi:hypothetical protein